MVLANGTSALGVIIVSAVANLRVVSTVIACCAKVRSLLLLGTFALSAGARVTAAFVRGDTRIAGAWVGSRLILGTPPGVLFRVTRECTRGVSLRFHFAVGFRDCKIGGAFVIRGTVGTMMMGMLSITLCCCIRVSLSLTLCPSNASVGFKIFFIFSWRSFMSRRPF